MKLLFLSSVITVPSSKGEAKIAKALNRGKSKPKTDDYGRNLEWYEENQLTPPLELRGEVEENSEIDENGIMHLKDDEFEYDFVDCVLRLDDFSSCIDNQEIGAVIYTKHGDELWVAESSEEIYGYIGVITRPWYTVLVDSIKYYFNSFLRKIKGEKKVD